MLVRAHEPTDRKKSQLGFPACLLSTPVSFRRLHFYYDKLQDFLFFDEPQVEKCWQKPKPGELQYAELGEVTGRGQKATMPRVSGTDTVYADIKS